MGYNGGAKPLLCMVLCSAIYSIGGKKKKTFTEPLTNIQEMEISPSPRHGSVLSLGITAGRYSDVSQRLEYENIILPLKRDSSFFGQRCPGIHFNISSAGELMYKLLKTILMGDKLHI